MVTVRKVVLVLVILAAALVTVPSAVAGFEVPNDWDYTDDDGGSADKVENIYIENRDETVLFGADISSQPGLSSDTLQVYIDTDQGETGKEGSSSGFYTGLEPVSADYRVSVSDGGLPIIQEYNGERYEFIKGVEYESESGIAVVEVEKETLDNPEAFDVRFAHIYGDVGDSDNYDWLPVSDIESYQVNNENIEINERKSAEIDVNPTFSEELDDASVEIVLTDDSGETVETETLEDVNTDDLTVPLTVDPENFNNDGEASAEVVVENDEDFVVNGDIDNTAAINTNLTDSDTEEVDSRLNFSYIKSEVTFRPSDDPDSTTFTLEDDDGNVRNRGGDTNTNPVSETFTVNSNDFDSDSGSVSVTAEGDRQYPDRSKSVTGVDNAPHVDFDFTNVSHEIAVENPQPSTLDVGKSNNEVDVNVSVSSGNNGSNINSSTHVIEFDDRIDEEQVSVDFKSPFDDGNIYNTNSAVDGGEIEIEMYSLGSSPIVASGNNETIASITFKLEDVNSIKQEIDQGNENSESLTINTVTEQSELRDADGDEVSYTPSDDDIEIKNSQTILTTAEVTHLTDGGDMVGAPVKIDVEVGTNEGELNKIELLDDDGNNRSHIDCNNESTCGEDATLKYTPDNPSEVASGTYVPRGHQIAVTTNSSDTFNLSEEFNSIEDSETGTAVATEIYVEGDVNRDGPLKSKTVRKSDVDTVIENRGEEADGLPWDDDELARADTDNDGIIDINDVLDVASEYDPAEGTVDFANDPLDVDADAGNDQVDINISDLNNNIEEDVDVVVVNNDEDETVDITTGSDSNLTGDESVDIDTTNVDSGDELEVQIHEVNDPDPDAAGGDPVDTATEKVKIAPEFDTAEVTDTNADQLRVTFDANVSASQATGFSITSDGSAINVSSFNTTKNSDTVVLDLDRSVTNGESLTADYDGSGDVKSSVDNSDAETFSGETVNNNVGS